MEGYGNENPGAFQPTRPVRGATEIAHKLTDTIKFQPTRPLRGATPCFHRGIAQSKFQPTRPLRGATRFQLYLVTNNIDFNPRAPCGARRHVKQNQQAKAKISTHAPLAGRDEVSPFWLRGLDSFQPTRPLRGATASSWLRI